MKIKKDNKINELYICDQSQNRTTAAWSWRSFFTYHCYITEVLRDRSISACSYSSLSFLLLFGFLSSSCLFLWHFRALILHQPSSCKINQQAHKRERKRSLGPFGAAPSLPLSLDKRVKDWGRGRCSGLLRVLRSVRPLVRPLYQTRGKRLHVLCKLYVLCKD